MRALYSFVFSLMALAAYSQHSPWLPDPLDSITVSDAGLIVLARLEESFDNNIAASVIIYFKGGRCAADHSFVLRAKDDRTDINFGSEYLIFAKQDEDCRYYIDKDSRIIRRVDSQKDIDFLISRLPCSDVKVKESMKGQACHRDYRPVIGCDSVTYGNLCEAIGNGIMISKRVKIMK